MATQDAHNHLQDEWLAGSLEAILETCRARGVDALVVNGTCEQDWPRVAALARAYPEVRPAFGVHPWDARQRSPGWLDTLRRTLDAHPEASMGEIGIDRWVLDGMRPDDPRRPAGGAAPITEQSEVFLAQLSLAAERNLPATIHCLDAWGALLDLLRSAPLPTRGFLLHAYSGPAELVPRFAALGAYFSFNGYFLHPRKTRQRATFSAVPPDRLLIETDAPAMYPPVEYNAASLPDAPTGERVTHPATVANLTAPLAALLGEDQAALETRLTANFRRLFGGEDR